MIMSKNADGLVTAFSPSARIRFVYAEVTDSARELERSHLCGPTAGLIQAEALAGVALLGEALTQPDEAISLRLRVSGPIGGILVEMRTGGGLRGYTQVKVLNDFDDCEELDASAALGEWAEVQIVRSIPGKILSSAMLEVTPASVIKGLETYFRNSLQRQVRVQLSALAYGGFIDSARGFLVECLPDGNPSVFDRVCKRLDDGTGLDCLESSASLPTLCETLGLEDCVFQEPRPLAFACSCSLERVEGVLAGMSRDELERMRQEGRSTQVFCQMCGKGYAVGADRLAGILKGKS